MVAGKQSFAERKTQEYQARYEEWERERKAYIAEHGLLAWDRKVEDEVRVLYPET